MKRWLNGLFALLFAVSYTVSLGSSFVSAASVYDDIFWSIDKVYLPVWNGTSYDHEDVTTNYFQYVVDEDALESLEDAIYGNGAWLVVSGNDSLSIFWSDDKDVTKTSFFESIYGPAWGIEYNGTNSWNHIRIWDEPLNGGIKNQVFLNQTSETIILLGDMPSPQPTDYGVFVSTYDNIYPAGYEGNEIPNDHSPVIKIHPEFQYSVSLKTVTVSDINQQLPEYTPDEGWTTQGYAIEWSLFKCDIWDDVGKICENPTLENLNIQPQGNQYSYDVPSYGDYYLSAQYLVQECFRYPSYPLTPDYCVYVDLGTVMEGYDFDPTSVYLEINGNNIAGDTRDSVCDSSGYCEPPSPYEDCSLHGIDLLAGFICVMRNFGIFLGIMFKQLFIPSPAFIENYIHEFGDYMSSKLGFLATAFGFVIDYVEVALDITPKCVIDDLPGTFFGTQLNLNLCVFEENYPNVFNAMMLIVRSLILVGVVFASRHQLIAIIKGLGR